MRHPILAVLTGATFMLSALPVLAHASFETSEAPAGSTFKAVIRIGHGCDGKPTRALRVRIPDGFYDAKPMPKPGWQLKTVTGDYARPFDNHGTQMKRGVREIVWSGGELPDDWYDEFTFRGSVGPEVVPGSTIYFPTVQECGGNAKEAWIDVTGAEGAANPAPALHVTEKRAEGGHAHHAAAKAEEVRVGDLAITDAYSRATPPGAPVGGGYLTVTNNGQAEDRLVSATSPAAGRVEIHDMAMEGEVMRMRKLDDGLPLPAGEGVEMKPGGLHLMLMDLKAPLAAGESVPVTLTFEKAGQVEVNLSVRSMNAKEAEHAHH
ncbi:MAG TPA: copper chaperone PCu(A)C [Paracoccus sp. (in: a-proteobacteria)]|uniref:copper chaperone PCu(A)C n=1 Tax=Paracoccus sp. TaxID=267 RepID=UPI002C3D0F47|nr:copper chaperone PCu(A)C [Paracoccus sp. (in: a-proteobacteria)]HWL58075.1 copper chaperone PCu(A)C [Paracoccus sp. (in: a-proteobacteria)]